MKSCTDRGTITVLSLEMEAVGEGVARVTDLPFKELCVILKKRNKNRGANLCEVLAIM